MKSGHQKKYTGSLNHGNTDLWRLMLKSDKKNQSSVNMGKFMLILIAFFFSSNTIHFRHSLLPGQDHRISAATEH